MIALFDEPPRISILPVAGISSRNGLLMGMSKESGAGAALLGIVVLEDGEVTLMHASHFVVDYRFDPESDRWVDTNVQPPTQQ